jgi:hypothetical protein
MQDTSNTITRWARGVEAEFFRTLNALVEPAVRAGCAAPGLVPTGMIVLETTGAKTGRAARVPLMTTVLEGCPFVGTTQGDRAQWLRNLRADQRVRYWLAGREHRGTALVFAAGIPHPRPRCFPLWPAPSPRACYRLRQSSAGRSWSSGPNAPRMVRPLGQPNDVRLPTGRRTTGRLGGDRERLRHSGSSVVANDRRLAIWVHGRRSSG